MFNMVYFQNQILTDATVHIWMSIIYGTVSKHYTEEEEKIALLGLI